jgi:hypothetical protein
VALLQPGRECVDVGAQRGLRRHDGDHPRSLLDYARQKLFDPLGVDTEPAYTGYEWLAPPTTRFAAKFSLRKSKTAATASRASRSLACKTPQRASLGTTARALTDAKIDANPAAAAAMNKPACTPPRLQLETPNPATAIAAATSTPA